MQCLIHKYEYFVELNFGGFLFLLADTTGTLIECNSAVLAMDGGEEDCGNLYIYQLDKT